MNKWEEFKDNYKNKFNEDPTILDYIAVVDILKWSLYGFSNEDIAGMLELDSEYVEKTLNEFLGFSGFEETLLFSPIAVHKKLGDKNPFYDLCIKYLEIERKVEEYYERH